ncbi:MAG: DNA cytosine methyltransferase [Stenotrophomonas sp.]
MSLTYLSVCSGIEAASVAWEPLGFKPIAFSEIEPFPCEVLRHHYPRIPNLGDMTAIDSATFRGKADILVGGTPCQAFSCAGLRQGLADDRGNLSLKFVELADAVWPSFIVWENVTGVEMLDSMSSAARTMRSAVFWQGLPAKICRFSLHGASARWGGVGRPDCVLCSKRTVAWRVYCSQFFALAQRRERAILVACPAGGADPTQILFEFEGMRRDSRSDSMLSSAPRIGGRFCSPDGIAGAVSCKWAKGTGGPSGDEHYNLIVAPPSVWPVDVRQAQRLAPARERSIGIGDENDPAYTLTKAYTHGAVIRTAQTSSNGWGINLEGIAYTVDQVQGQAVALEEGVRRFTPLECERLQGLPDYYTDVRWRGKPASDTARYRAIGNSMPVTVMRWVGERILHEQSRTVAVERRPIGELLPYARNARTHSDAQVAQIAASMTEFGCARASRR